MDATAALVGVAPALPLARRVPLLVARGLVRRFEHGRGVGPVDLTLDGGQFVALTGPSGAGKTTLLRLLAGLDAPTAGSLQLDAGERRVRRGDTRIALVFQQPRLSGRVSVLHNVLGGRLGHLPRWRGLLQRYAEADLRLALQALADVGLLALANERTDRLSGGEQQRVAIARALAQQPQVLLADEPVASLDPDNAQRVMQALRRCRERGLAVVASLHQPQLAAEHADRVMRLAAGRRVD